MVKVGQTLHVGGQYGPIGEPSVLYFTQIHPYGHEVEYAPTSHPAVLLGVLVWRGGVEEGRAGNDQHHCQSWSNLADGGSIWSSGRAWCALFCSFSPAWCFTRQYCVKSLYDLTHPPPTHLDEMTPLAPQYDENGLHHSHVALIMDL